MERFFVSGKYLKFQKQSGDLYAKFIDEAAKQIGLTRQEADVLVFFANNSEYTSAIDAVKVRGFSKAYVSKAVLTLVEKGMITIEQDKNDRRIQHVQLTEAAKKVIGKLQKTQFRFSKLMGEGLSEEDKKTMLRVLEKLADNVDRACNSD